MHSRGDPAPRGPTQPNMGILSFPAADRAGGGGCSFGVLLPGLRPSHLTLGERGTVSRNTGVGGGACGSSGVVRCCPGSTPHPTTPGGYTLRWRWGRSCGLPIAGDGHRSSEGTEGRPPPPSGARGPDDDAADGLRGRCGGRRRPPRGSARAGWTRSSVCGGGLEGGGWLRVGSHCDSLI